LVLNFTDSKSNPQFERQQIVDCFKITNFMPSKSVDEQNLKELSLIEFANSSTFASTNMIEGPAPRNAKVPIARNRTAVPKKLDMKLDEIKNAIEEFKNLYLVVKRLIGFTKLSESEKQLY
jgi:hypothetical protein